MRSKPWASVFPTTPKPAGSKLVIGPMRKYTAFLLLTAGIVSGQLRYEVASIRPSNQEAGRSSINTGNGDLHISNATVKQIMMSAYDVRDFQIAGGPRWIETDRFDINANSDRQPSSNAQRDQNQERMRNLLEDRFQIRIRRENREQSIFALVVTRTGAKLQPADSSKGNSGTNTNTSNGRGKLVATATPLDNLARVLSGITGRHVANRTSLEGAFDFTLEWSSDLDQSQAGNSEAGPSIFTVLQEQLGLRLESTRGPVEVLIIVRAEMPSEN